MNFFFYGLQRYKKFTFFLYLTVWSNFSSKVNHLTNHQGYNHSIANGTTVTTTTTPTTRTTIQINVAVFCPEFSMIFAIYMFLKQKKKKECLFLPLFTVTPSFSKA